MQMEQIIARLFAPGLIPIVAIDDARQAVKTAQALRRGGADVVEITLRTDAALETIRRIAAEVPEISVGAGTVLTLRQCEQSVRAGAQFVVTPDCHEEIIDWCAARGVVVIPGCVTPTEIGRAVRCGVSVVKFFPAKSHGGIEGLRELSGPFAGVRFVPTSGTAFDNLGAYAAAPFVHAVGGLWMCTQADIRAGNFERISRATAEAVREMLGFEPIGVQGNVSPEDLSAGLPDWIGELLRSAKDRAGMIQPAVSSAPAAGGEFGTMTIRVHNCLRTACYLEQYGFVLRANTAEPDEKYTVQEAYLMSKSGKSILYLKQKGECEC